MRIKIADFPIVLRPDFDLKTTLFNNYLCEHNDNNFTIDVIKRIIDKGYDDNNGTVRKGIVFMFYVLEHLAQKLPYNSSFLLHSVVFDINGAGVAFSALSGTGKSTHLANWYAYLNGTENMPESLKRLLKDENLNIEKDGNSPKLTIVNGDKPIVRFFDEDFCKQNNLEIPKGTEFGVPYAYGTPWCGKEGLGCNMRTPLKHICFIERSDTNFVTKIDKTQAVERIMKQVYMPKDPVALSKTLELVNRLINSCELWIIHCNMEPESAEVAYKAIFG